MAIRWTAFPLHPETPEEGRSLEDLFAGRGVDLDEVLDRLRRVAEAEGLPLGRRKTTYNSRLAQELGKWAEKKGKGEEFHRATFHAYFADGLNIATTTVLLQLADEAGLSTAEALEVLETRAFKDPVDQDWARSRSLGITAVPTLLLNRRVLVGAQPYETMKRFLESEGVSPRKHSA